MGSKTNPGAGSDAGIRAVGHRQPQTRRHSGVLHIKLLISNGFHSSNTSGVSSIT
jgi:hypothetical protein